MGKKALLIGLHYASLAKQWNSADLELPGAIVDPYLLRQMLIGEYQYLSHRDIVYQPQFSSRIERFSWSKDDITVLTDAPNESGGENLVTREFMVWIHWQISSS